MFRRKDEDDDEKQELSMWVKAVIVVVFLVASFIAICKAVDYSNEREMMELYTSEVTK
jgi:hypothetical protein